jgi:tetratricopeptide (TPR) repeat protein
MGRFSWLELAGQPSPEEAEQFSRGEVNEEVCLENGNGYLRQGQYETALQWYSRALRFDLTLAAAWAGQVQCLLFLKEFPEASIWADRALEKFQDDPDLLAAKAMALSRTANTAAALAYSDAALTVKGKNVGPFPWIARGYILLGERNSRPAAMRCFNKALELAGKDWYTHYLIGASLLERGCLDEALLRLSAGVELERRSALQFCALGECRERMGDLKPAMAAYRRAREADPLCKPARERLLELQQMGVFSRIWRSLMGRR